MNEWVEMRRQLVGCLRFFAGRMEFEVGEGGLKGSKGRELLSGIEMGEGSFAIEIRYHLRSDVLHKMRWRAQQP